MREVPAPTVLDVPVAADDAADDDGDGFGMDAGTVDSLDSGAPSESEAEVPATEHVPVASSRTGVVPAQVAGVAPTEPARAGKPSSEKKPAEKKAVSAAAKVVDSDKTSYVYVPRNIANIISGLIPQASNRNDAITTFLYIALNREPEVSDKIKELSAGYTGDGELDNLRSQVELLRASVEATGRRLVPMEEMLAEIVTMLVWLIGDKRNASIDYSGPVERTDFLFKEHSVIRSMVAAQTKEYTNYVDDLKSRLRYKTAAAARDHSSK